MRFLSVCSGIEAASVAWNPLGWQAVAFSEIEPFPCAVLAHHYPGVPNWGDMTNYKEWPDADIDLLCGGTPCQSFSVAGLRKGLDDPRGDLMLTFGAIADKYRPRWLVWENVPGVLSSNGGRDFGTFLGMLGQLGYGFAYRVLDAQHFGIPQRRRRVFVVGYFGDWRRAAAVLFERHSLSGHPAPSRKKREGVAPTLSARTRGGGGLGTDFECDGGLIPEIVGTMKSCAKSGGWSNSADHAAAGYMVPAAYSIQAGATRTNPNSGPDGVGVQRDRAYTLEARSEVQCVAFSSKDYGGDASMDLSPTLRAMGHAKSHANAGGQLAVCVTGSVAHTLKAEGFDASEDGTGRGQPIVAARTVSLRGRDGGSTAELGDAVGNCLRASSGGGDKPYVLAFTQGNLKRGAGPSPNSDTFPTLTVSKGSGTSDQQPSVLTPQMAVRRLTPRECERLQGFPDDYTLTPYRGKPAADGPRYKSLGNSWAVPVARWIGERIEQVESLEVA